MSGAGALEAALMAGLLAVTFMHEGLRTGRPDHMSLAVLAAGAMLTLVPG